MVNPDTIGAAVVRWASDQPSVSALVLIGSQVHANEAGAQAPDAHSDWDFQIVTDHPAQFSDRAWMRGLGLGEPLAYVARLGRLGSATKVSVVLPGGELDLVIISARTLRLARRLVKLGLGQKFERLRRGLCDLAIVLGAGHRVMKGKPEWEPFLRRVVAEFPPTRLDDSAIKDLAEGFVCDYVSTRHKIQRGEFIAAQRWLHHQLAEVNFRLLHEFRQREGKPSLPDARRLELMVDDAQPIAVSAIPTRESLNGAIEKAASTCRDLVRALVGEMWRWPDV